MMKFEGKVTKRTPTKKPSVEADGFVISGTAHGIVQQHELNQLIPVVVRFERTCNGYTDVFGLAF